MAGFGFKTSWLAVRRGSVAAVADELGLVDRRPAGWADGTGEAYRRGVYVVSVCDDWTLAHGVQHLPGHGVDGSMDGFPEWLSAVSARLGEVQFFGSHRAVDYVAWALARGGTLERGYAYTGDDGVVLNVGEPTAIERELGIGVVPLDSWSDDEYDTWFRLAGDEEHVMQVAGAWSIDPHGLTEDDVRQPGVLGMPGDVGSYR
ncbi:DUF6928 family protein [Dactylosporangium sp. McL0621]|uniref:DUF6928 family protein n=1 Tax=Dactylosporangium sp. McL0621 TaxID=3415678 RepID=UPI003CE84269